MKQRSILPIRALALFLALIMGTAGFCATIFTLINWDEIWTGAGFYNSSEYYRTLYDYYTDTVRELSALLQKQRWGEKLSYLEEQALAVYQSALSAENTNFRVRLLDNNTGELLYSNLPQDSSKEALENAVHEINYTSRELTSGTAISDNDYTGWDEAGERRLIYIYLPDWSVISFGPEDAEQAAQYGWLISGYDNWTYHQDLDSRVKSAVLAMEYGVTDPLQVEDVFQDMYRNYVQYAQYLPLIALAALVMDAIAISSLIYLCANAGRRKNQEGLYLGYIDRIPLDLLAVILFFIAAALISAVDSIFYNLRSTVPGDAVFTENLVGLALFSLAIGGCTLAGILTLVVRCKTRTLFTNTVIWRTCVQAGRICRELYGSWPLMWRAAALFGLYLVGTLLTTLTIFLIPLYQGIVLYGICRWCLQWKQVQDGLRHIVGGDPDYKINTSGHMYRDLREHAGQLNDLGGAISSAVEEQLRSERFKAELITNVSHDLKTPLTSIINYVDLLKKQDIQDPAAAEYIAVLDRKSQRLKKLTEDLVEASKASTGNLTVNRERLGMVQLVQQAVGEFEEKFTQSGLTLVAAFPPEEVYVRADGRRLWRIIENLLSNCHKYALAGTRVYLDVMHWEGNVILSIKNISRQQLNIPAAQLVERFVRGEESRTTEGSGLGLSIAQNLTELQGGAFRLDIDGDLFKASVTLPEDSMGKGGDGLPTLPPLIL